MASFGKKTEILKRGLDDVHLDYKLAQQIADKTMDVLGKISILWIATAL